MVKNISQLGTNFAGSEGKNMIANGVLNINPTTEIGRQVVEESLM